MSILHTKKILFLGGGNMATAIISGLLEAFPALDILIVDRNEKKLDNLQNNYSVTTSTDLETIYIKHSPDIIILAIKPKDVPEACQALRKYINANSVIISLAAGLTLSKLKSLILSNCDVIRTMPNTPASIGMGMTILYNAPGLNQCNKQLAEEIFTAVGSTIWVEEEEQINNMMAISGCGPAYVFLMCESLMNAAISLGIDHKNAKRLVASTISGSIQLFSSSSKSPEVLRSEVTSPNGTTAAAIAELNPEATKKTYNLALAAAVNKAKIIESELENL